MSGMASPWQKAMAGIGDGGTDIIAAPSAPAAAPSMVRYLSVAGIFIRNDHSSNNAVFAIHDFQGANSDPSPVVVSVKAGSYVYLDFSDNYLRMKNGVRIKSDSGVDYSDYHAFVIHQDGVAP